jgi:hypothetical protein
MRYLATNNAFYDILVNTTKENALAYVQTCKGGGFRAFQGLLKQMQTFRFNPKVHPRADAAAFVEMRESLRESEK